MAECGEEPVQLCGLDTDLGLPAINPRILELEQKPKPLLAHEVGEGAKCLTCGDNCPGLDPHFWRKLCKACKHKILEHDVHDTTEDPGKIRIGRLFDVSPDKRLHSDIHTPIKLTTGGGESELEECGKVADLRQKFGSLPALDLPPPTKFEWVPPNSDSRLVAKFMDQLPEDQRPVVGTLGALNRKKTLAYQVPLHDVEENAMHKELNPEERQTMANYVKDHRRSAVGQGRIQETEAGTGDWPPPPSESELRQLEAPASRRSPLSSCAKTCAACRVPMKPGEISLFTQHSGPDVCWHPTCFKCCKCQQLLVDMLYFFRDNQYYCGRHFGDTMFPRCNGCDELIFSREFTRAEDHDWHLNHFCCFGCDAELAGKRYMVRDDNPYCFDCYMLKFAKKCALCDEKIGPDVKRISHQELHWHATADCFKCANCSSSLVNARFIIKLSHTFCSGNCKEAFFRASNGHVPK